MLCMLESFLGGLTPKCEFEGVMAGGGGGREPRRHVLETGSSAMVFERVRGAIGCSELGLNYPVFSSPPQGSPISLTGTESDTTVAGSTRFSRQSTTSLLPGVAAPALRSTRVSGVFPLRRRARHRPRRADLSPFSALAPSLAVANHGIIPRDGRHITPVQLAAAVHNTYNLSPTLSIQLLAAFYPFYLQRRVVGSLLLGVLIR